MAGGGAGGLPRMAFLEFIPTATVVLKSIRYLNPLGTQLVENCKNP